MNMKEMCKKFLDDLDGIITDSFYDDDGNGFVELDIENPDTVEKNIQIEIDSEYYGFSYCCYDEIYSYDGTESDKIPLICNKIRSILGKTACVIKIETADDEIYKLAEITAIDNNSLAKLISEETSDAKDGKLKIILWNTEIEKEFSYDGEEYVFF